MKKDVDCENLSIDSITVRAHQSSAGWKKGKKFRSKSVHLVWVQAKEQPKNAIVDELGNLIYIKLTARQTHNSTKLLKYCLT